MKAIYNKILAAVFLSLFIISCDNGGDDSIVDYTDGAVNKWAYETLRRDYLWSEDMEGRRIDYSRDYRNFFESLLSDKDGKHDKQTGQEYYYSYIRKITRRPDETRIGENDLYTSSFGFDFILTEFLFFDPVLSDKEVYKRMYAVVSYIIPGSPADIKGLERGDFIEQIDGSHIPSSHYDRLLSKLMPESNTGVVPSNVRLGKANLEPIGIHPEYRLPIVRKSGKNEDISMSPAQVSTNPIFMNEVYDAGSRKVGYLVYNQFERGALDNPAYDNDLKMVMKDFKAQGVNELVLDLRYNPGGYVSSCQLLSSMIAPVSVAGTPFQIEKFRSQTRTRPFLRENEMASEIYGEETGTNLELTKVYVIATHSSASASEALIHGLRGAGMPVYHIGNRTEGKNVGMSGYFSYDNKDLDYETFYYEMWPVTFYIYNAQDQTYSSEGLEPLDSPYPGYVYYEDFQFDWKDLGDTEEPLLKAALTHIETGSFPVPGTRTAEEEKIPYVSMPVKEKPVYKDYIPVRRPSYYKLDF